MFQYTTETIINSENGKLIDGKRFGVYAATGGDAAISSGATAEDFLLIDGANSFVLKNIKSVYRNPYRAEAKATATLDLNAVGSTYVGKLVRLTVVLREQGSVRSAMQNAYLHKSKPFHYEIAVPAAGVSTTVAAELAKALVKIVNKDMSMTDFDFFKAAVDSSDAENVILTADDCYIQFVDVKLEEVLDIEDSATPLGAKLLGANVTKAIAGVTVAKTAGDEGAGTVTRLVKNLRIPTGASINPFAADQGGRPVPGGQYDQYLIEYETPRHHVSGTVMGSVGEVSRTSHVFFINTAVASLNTAWKAAITLACSKANGGAGISDPTSNANAGKAVEAAKSNAQKATKATGSVQ